MIAKKEKNNFYGMCLLVTIIILTGLVFQSCKGSLSKNSNKLVVAIQASPVTLDPRLATDAEGDKISSLMCDGLYIRDNKLENSPNLAERFETISDTSYKFYLRPDLKFSDGTPLTADDVVYTYRSVIDGKVISPFKSSFERIATIEAESPTVVKVEMKAAYAPFLTIFTRGIVSRAAVEQKGEKFGMEPVCSGPYKLIKFVPDSVVELAVNEDYFGEKPRLAGIEFQIIKDDNIRVMKLIKGDVDLVQNGISPMLIESVMKNPNLTKLEDTSVVVTYMGLNLSDPILAKKEVREAIAYAIDRDEVINHRWKGLAVKANSVLSPANWAYDPGLMQYPYDPVKANKLLDAAGLKDKDGGGDLKRFKLVYKTTNVKDRIDIARLISHQLEKVGIATKVEPYEWGTFFKDVKSGNFQLYTLSWVGVTEPDIFFDILHSTQWPPVGLNRDRYKNSRVDELVEKGRVTMDQAERKKIYAEIQKIVLEDLPLIPLWYEKNVVIYRKDLKNVSLRPDAFYRTFANIEK